MKEKTRKRIGLAQTDILWENVEENKKRAEEFFQKAKENHVELLLFPEMSLTGFSMNVEKITKDWEEQVEFFRERSLYYEMTVVFGCAVPVNDRQWINEDRQWINEDRKWVNEDRQWINEDRKWVNEDRQWINEDQKETGDQQELFSVHGAGKEREEETEKKNYENHLFVIENGRIRMDYRKIHPFTYGQEGEYFQGGKQIITMEWEKTTLGAFICYDLRFPEIFQISSEDSAIIVVIANWPETRIRQWDCLLQARAIENQCFIAGVNRTGKGGGLSYNGHSALYGPTGERMTVLCEEESLLIGDVDVEEVRKLREAFPVKKDRKEALYSKNSLLCV